MKQKKYCLILGLIIFIQGCASNRIIKENQSLQSVVPLLSGKPALIFIADYPLEGRLMALEANDLLIQGRSETWRIPSECVRMIQTDSGGHGTTGMILGGIAGALIGGAGGWFIAREAATSDVSAIGHPVTLGAAVGAASAGVILGAGRKTIRQYRFPSTAELYTLHEEVGETLTPAEIKYFEVFTDLKKENEQILLIQVVRFADQRFLLLYDLYAGKKYLTRIKIVDAGYIKEQETKIQDHLSRSSP